MIALAATGGVFAGMAIALAFAIWVIRHEEPMEEGECDTSDDR